MLSVLDLFLVLSNNINNSRVLRKTTFITAINGAYNMPKSKKKPNKKEEKLADSADTANKKEQQDAKKYDVDNLSRSPCRFERPSVNYWNTSFSYPPHVSQQECFYPVFYSTAGPIVTSNVGGFFRPNFLNYSRGYGLHSSTSLSDHRFWDSPPRKHRSRSNKRRQRRGQTEKMVLDSRVWEDVKNENMLTGPGLIFTVMTYNVLAQDLISQHQYLYRDHRLDDLEWPKRWANLMKEFKSIHPDILCLQEVQESHLIDYYKQLENFGYKGIFKKRTGLRIDGCAIYYKANKLTLLEYTTVEYFQPNISVLNRDNIAIIAKFAPKTGPSKEFIIATTHLLYNPKRHDVRLAQTQLLLAEIDRFTFKHISGRYIPIIITGDFNSSPDSPLYEFITKGQLRYEELMRGKVLVPSHLRITDSCQYFDFLESRRNNGETTQNDKLALAELRSSDHFVKKTEKQSTSNPSMFCSGTLCHYFPFKSVYRHYQDDDVEGTTYQEKWHTVDYIFYSGKKEPMSGIEEDKLRLVSRYRLPTAKQLENLRIPSNNLGSDHLSLVARFKLDFL